MEYRLVAEIFYTLYKNEAILEQFRNELCQSKGFEPQILFYYLLNYDAKKQKQPLYTQSIEVSNVVKQKIPYNTLTNFLQAQQISTTESQIRQLFNSLSFIYQQAGVDYLDFLKLVTPQLSYSPVNSNKQFQSILGENGLKLNDQQLSLFVAIMHIEIELFQFIENQKLILQTQCKANCQTLYNEIKGKGKSEIDLKDVALLQTQQNIQFSADNYEMLLRRIKKQKVPNYTQQTISFQQFQQLILLIQPYSLRSNLQQQQQQQQLTYQQFVTKQSNINYQCRVQSPTRRWGIDTSQQIDRQAILSKSPIMKNAQSREFSKDNYQIKQKDAVPQIVVQDQPIFITYNAQKFPFIPSYIPKSQEIKQTLEMHRNKTNLDSFKMGGKLFTYNSSISYQQWPIVQQNTSFSNNNNSLLLTNKNQSTVIADSLIHNTNRIFSMQKNNSLENQSPTNKSLINNNSYIQRSNYNMSNNNFINNNNTKTINNVINGNNKIANQWNSTANNEIDQNLTRQNNFNFKSLNSQLQQFIQKDQQARQSLQVNPNNQISSTQTINQQQVQNQDNNHNVRFYTPSSTSKNMVKSPPFLPFSTLQGNATQQQINLNPQQKHNKGYSLLDITSPIDTYKQQSFARANLVGTTSPKQPNVPDISLIQSENMVQSPNQASIFK
eukprot:TRINITY_DN2512_c0_g1_i1.p1 TRINITY_DN2512_c0_g1~~TRINITY_DN2512_c0_g1_i1.p1  ORF type:complete len:665 (+),score=79.48 TRINITY_DN2512_c0_g1_i1:43-2037(+)